MTDIDVVAPTYNPPQSTQPPPESDAYDAGEQAGEELLELAPVDIKHGEPGEIEFLLSEFDGDVQSHLERAAGDPEFAAGLVNKLGPEGYARLVAAIDRTPLLDQLGDSEKSEKATELLSLLGQTLGSATRMPGSPVDAEFIGQVTENDGFVTDGELDPELAAILLNEGEYTPETAAMLAGHVFLESDPPQVYDQPEGYIDTAEHRKPLLTPAEHNVEPDNVGAWATAIHGLMRNGGSSELLSLRDASGKAVIAERLLDPNLAESPQLIPDLVHSILDTPRLNLASNPDDAAAMSAVESLLLASKSRHGDVNETAASALGELYMDFAPEILNAGEGASAFPTARDSALGRFLADSDPLQAGDGSFVLTAALTATDTPPHNPDSTPINGDPRMGPSERFGSWPEALQYATASYRSGVEEHGPPKKDASGGQTYPDLNALATEIADIDGELLTATYGANAIAAADVDDENALKQQVFNVITDYVGLGVGFIPGAGPALAVSANGYNAHLEGALVETLFPTDAAQRVFSDTVPKEQQQLLAAQAARIVDSYGRNGGELPESLRDPQTGGLRQATSDADAQQLASDLADYIESTPAVHEAVDLARAQLEERTNALDAGQYRGG